MKLEEIFQTAQNKFGRDVIVSEDASSSPVCLQLSGEALLKVCKWLKETEGVYFDHLASITGVDNGEKEGTMEVVYHLYSIPYNHSLALKVVVGRDQPEVPSLTELWGAANWHERETYDLLGIIFAGHPDLRRILLPGDWEGHPLRKDYEAKGSYHGLPLDYDEARGEEG